MAEKNFLKQNIKALSRHHPQLARSLSLLDPHPRLIKIMAHSGLPVPAFIREGHPFLLHSRFDPLAEGRRFISPQPAGVFLVFGLAGGYHLNALIESPQVSRLIIVEKDPTFVRGLLEIVNLSEFFSDPRLRLLIDPKPEELSRYVRNDYLSILDGELNIISLRSRLDSEPTWFEERMEVLEEFRAQSKQDYNTQIQLGRRWFANTINNLASSEESRSFLVSSKNILVSAAGPSLEKQLPLIREYQADGAMLMATDTSLPVLLAAKINPELVLSIDCQTISYQHFFKKLAPETTLVLDLASPPLLTRLSKRLFFFTTQHPLSLYLGQNFRSFPLLDISGGNVTHAALSLADLLGAEQVRLFGADFSYPQGRPYARGSYFYPYFHSYSSRSNSAENGFWTLIAAAHPRREEIGNTWRLRTDTLDSYHQALEQAMESMPFHLLVEKGSGLAINSGNSKKKWKPRSSPINSNLTAGIAQKNWRDFLIDYHRKLEELPPISGSLPEYFGTLNEKNLQIWTTLFPTAASFKKKKGNTIKALAASKVWALKHLASLLS